MIEKVKRLDIKRVITSHTELTFRGNTLSSCPFCGSGKGPHKTSAFSVKNNFFHCYACQRKGSNIDFIMALRSMEFSDALTYLQRWGNILPDDRPPFPRQVSRATPRTLAEYGRWVRQNDHRPACDYLDSRHVATYNFDNNHPFHWDSESNAIVFIDVDEKLINKRYFVPKNGTKSTNHRGSVIKNSLYAGAWKDSSETVFLCEGAINAICIRQVAHSALAIFTTSNHFTDAEKLGRYIGGRHVVLAFDPDKAGEGCTEYYRDFILSSGIPILSLRQLNFPRGTDANDMLADHSLKKHIADPLNYIDLMPDFHEGKLLNQLVADSENPERDQRLYRFTVHNGCYAIYKPSTEGARFTAISNFTMRSIYHFRDGSNDTVRLMQLRNKNGEKSLVLVSSSEFRPTQFETVLRSHGCSFFGTPTDLKYIFARLCEEEQVANQIESFGHSHRFDHYALSNGLLVGGTFFPTNTLGVVHNQGKSFYIPSGNLRIEGLQGRYAGERRFRYIEGKIDFADWSRLLVEAWGMKGAAALSYVVLSLFRDVVHSGINYFPYLYLFGEPGGGKTSIIELLTRLFGLRDVGVSVKGSTLKGIARSFDQKRNAVVYLKEFDSIPTPEIVALFKGGYDGAGYTIAQASTDNRTHNFFVETGIIIDGNVMPTTDNALFDRMVVLHFNQTSFSESQIAAYHALHDEAERGLGQILARLLSKRELFRRRFEESHRRLVRQMKASAASFHGADLTGVSARTLDHIALMLTVWDILGDELEVRFDREEYRQYVLGLALEKSETMRALDHRHIFWQALNAEHLSPRGELRMAVEAGDKGHYCYDASGSRLYIKLPETHALYVNYCKKAGIQYVDLTTLRKLFTSGGYEAFVNTEGKTASLTHRKLGRAYQFVAVMKEGVYTIGDSDIVFIPDNQ